MSRLKIVDPLYTASPQPPKSSVSESPSTGRNVVTARIENTRSGVCPKCHTAMATAPLGQCMGNQKVFFCNTCRVAEPIPVAL